MCVCVCIYVCARICIYMCVCARLWPYIHKYSYILITIYICSFDCPMITSNQILFSLSLSLYIYIYTYVCVCVCVCV